MGKPTEYQPLLLVHLPDLREGLHLVHLELLLLCAPHLAPVSWAILPCTQKLA
jgi:hypothetical protein